MLMEAEEGEMGTNKNILQLETCILKDVLESETHYCVIGAQLTTISPEESETCTPKVSIELETCTPEYVIELETCTPEDVPEFETRTPKDARGLKICTSKGNLELDTHTPEDVQELETCTPKDAIVSETHSSGAQTTTLFQEESESCTPKVHIQLETCTHEDVPEFETRTPKDASGLKICTSKGNLELDTHTPEDVQELETCTPKDVPDTHSSNASVLQSQMHIKKSSSTDRWETGHGSTSSPNIMGKWTIQEISHTILASDVEATLQTRDIRVAGYRIYYLLKDF